MTFEQIATHYAHLVAADLARAGIPPPEHEVKGVAVLEAEKIRVFVSITKAEPAYLFLAPGVDSGPFPGAIQASTLPQLRDVEQAAYNACPATGEKPVTIKRLANITGYSYNTYFRDAVRRLVDLGLVVRCTGGVRRA